MARPSQAKPDYAFLAALDQPIRPPRTSSFYALGLLLATVTMLLLPLIYLLFTAGIAWAVFYHASHHWHPLMGSGSGRILIFKFFLFLAPLAAGLVVLFFMFKPLLARQPKCAQPLALNPADNPLLYAFIHKICDAVGAPAPKRVDLNCELNASAGFRRGFRSMLGNDLVLTIGLPLAGNLSAHELGGIIAHEFGHFTQGTGMRLAYLIRSINDWFARIAYERDAWDEALEKWSDEAADGRAAVMVWCVQLAVWFSRLILKGLLLTGNVIAGFMLRQMEFNADAYQIQVVGSAVFEQTHRKLATLAAAQQLAHSYIGSIWEKRRQLPDNICELLRRAHESLPPNVREQIDDRLGFERSGIFASHPSPAERIRRARIAGAPGIFHDDRPASSLFASFRHPASFVTLLHYTDDLGIPIHADMLYHVETDAKQNGGEAQPSSREAYFFGALPLLLPLRLPTPVALFDVDPAQAELCQLASGLNGIADQLRSVAVQWESAARDKVRARTALMLMGAGVPVPPEMVTWPDATLEGTRNHEQQCVATEEDLRRSLHEVSAAMQRRLELALSLQLAAPHDAAADPERPQRILEIVAQLNAGADEYVRRREIVEALGVLEGIRSLRKPDREQPQLEAALRAQHEAITRLRSQTAASGDSGDGSGERAQTGNERSKPSIRLARQPAFTNDGDVASLGQETARWLGGYLNSIEELVELAAASEPVSNFE